MSDSVETAPQTPHGIYRHNYSVRICHWINVLAVGYLAVSGMAILLDFPELYWGREGYEGFEPSFKLKEWGITMEGNRLWGRNMHFLFSWVFALNGLAYLIWNISRRGLFAKILPRRSELAPGHLLADVRAHLRLRASHAVGRDYNTLQKLSYAAVIFVLCPMLVVTGLAQAPGFTTGVPWLLEMFGGKQTARSLHVLCMVLLLLFVLVHIFQVFVAGFVNEVRSMITGWFRLPQDRK